MYTGLTGSLLPENSMVVARLNAPNQALAFTRRLGIAQQQGLQAPPQAAHAWAWEAKVCLYAPDQALAFTRWLLPGLGRLYSSRGCSTMPLIFANRTRTCMRLTRHRPSRAGCCQDWAGCTAAGAAATSTGPP